MPSLRLSISATPTVICAYDLATCPAQAPSSVITLSAGAIGSGRLVYPNVQVAFVLETTPYDGVFDSTDAPFGTEPCADKTGGLVCEESNAVPSFVVNAGAIAGAIQAANSRSNVSFALIDYGSTLDAWDDSFGDSTSYFYHVDVANFVPAAAFGTDVRMYFQGPQLACSNGWVLCDSDLIDNFLHSSSITALYAALAGGLLGWAANAHHVIVWIGSTAPRDRSYVQDYCVSPSAYTLYGCDPSQGVYSGSCEPGSLFPTGASPACLGWVRSQDGSPADSLAALSRSAPNCVNSVGGRCTIDTIDLWTTSTDPYSPGWPTHRAGGGPGGSLVLANVNRVLRAGCDLAAATGGSWDGPDYFVCPDGTSGTLLFVPHGPIDDPNPANPTLTDALVRVSFGPVLESQVARGTDWPLFTFVPFANFSVGPTPNWRAVCNTPTGRVACPSVPTRSVLNGQVYYGWNFSAIPDQNVMYTGDSWTASFEVVDSGPPFGLLPVDACSTLLCLSAGSHPLAGIFSAATYLPVTNFSVVVSSFPVAMLFVEAPPILPSSGIPPPPTGTPPAGSIPVVPPVPAAPLLPAISVSSPTPLSAVEATAAGILAAGFMRLAVRNRPLAIKLAVKRPGGPERSRFEIGLEGRRGQEPRGTHWE